MARPIPEEAPVTTTVLPATDWEEGRYGHCLLGGVGVGVGVGGAGSDTVLK